jgi:site-specific DNA-cytosine methylase
MGLERCGWEVKFANDISEKKFEMYEDFFPGSEDHYKIEDVLSSTARRFPARSWLPVHFHALIFP